MKKLSLLTVLLLPVLILSTTLTGSYLSPSNSVKLGNAAVDSVQAFTERLSGISDVLEKLYDGLNLFSRDRLYGGYTLDQLNHAFRWEFDHHYMNYFQFIWIGLKWNRFTFKETTNINDVWNWNENNPFIYPPED